MSTQYQETKKPRILIIGSTGRIGSRVLAEIAKVDAVEAVYSSRTLEQVDTWHKDGKDAVFLDLDRPETFREALTGVDRLFLATGYTVAMVHQSKTIVDAAADAGVGFIVHLGIFGNGRMTYPYATWHEMVERYIEGSGVAWAHLHPHFFMDNLLAASPVVNGKFYWFMGEQAVGWVAPEDVAAVASKVLTEGPKRHRAKQYWLSTDFLNGTEAAAEQADQIFSAFFTTKPHGTGMGLSISRSIVESHSGRLWAADNSSRGASFHIILPTKVEAHELMGPPAA